MLFSRLDATRVNVKEGPRITWNTVMIKKERYKLSESARASHNIIMPYVSPDCWGRPMEIKIDRRHLVSFSFALRDMPSIDFRSKQRLKITNTHTDKHVY